MRWALPLLLGLALSACVGEAGPMPPVAGSGDLKAPTATSEPSTSIGSTASGIDAGEVVRAGLTATGPSYRFSSVVAIGDETLTTITGVVDGDSVSAEIATGNQSVSYVRTGQGEWVTDADGNWVALEGDPPVSPPLDALSDVTGLVAVSGDGDDGLFTGVLGAASGGAQGLPFSITIRSGLVSEIRYQVENGGQVAEVVTSLTDVGAAGPIEPPAGV